MKLKLLFFPFVWIISLVLIIWYIVPEVSEIKNAKEELGVQNKKIQEIMGKKDNLKNLIADLDSNLEKEKTGMDYLSLEKKSEDIINLLNYLAIGSGVSISRLEVDESGGKNSLAEYNLAISGSNSLSATGLDAGIANAKESKSENLEETTSSSVQAGAVKISLAVSGSYENIKSYADRIYASKRLNNISKLSIKSSKSSTESEEDASAGLLVGEMNIYYGYLPRFSVGMDRNLSDPIFSRSNFDFSIIEKIGEISNENAPSVEVGEQGSSNPFIL